MIGGSSIGGPEMKKKWNLKNSNSSMINGIMLSANIMNSFGDLKQVLFTESGLFNRKVISVNVAIRL